MDTEGIHLCTYSYIDKKKCRKMCDRGLRGVEGPLESQGQIRVHSRNQDIDGLL